MSEIDNLYEIRAYEPNDKSFVMATFLRGLYYGDSWFSKIEKNAFMSAYKHVAESLVNRSNIFVACLKDDASVILGYSIVSKDLECLHFIYVKAAWRKQGIARRLTPKTITTVTHLTALGVSLLPKLNAVFNPFKVG